MVSPESDIFTKENDQIIPKLQYVGFDGGSAPKPILAIRDKLRTYRLKHGVITGADMFFYFCGGATFGMQVAQVGITAHTRDPNSQRFGLFNIELEWAVTDEKKVTAWYDALKGGAEPNWRFTVPYPSPDKNYTMDEEMYVRLEAFGLLGEASRAAQNARVQALQDKYKWGMRIIIKSDADDPQKFKTYPAQ